MDNLTHTLTGLMLARCGLGTFAGRGFAGAAGATRGGVRPGGPVEAGTMSKNGLSIMLMLAANAPDLDVVAWAGGTLTFLDIHRGYAHSLAFAPLVALVPLFLVRWLARVPLTRFTYLACLMGVLSHLALDWTNVYGIRLLLPFSGSWLRLDTTDIVDPWILLILLGAMAAPALAGMVNSEIASKKVAPPLRRWAQVALAAVLLYDGGRWVLHQRAVAVLGAHLYGGDWVPRRVSAMPSRFNPWEWRGIVEGGGFVDEIPVDLTTEFDPGAGRISYVTSFSRAIDAARQSEPFRVFARFNQIPFWRDTPVPDGFKVELIDLRFGTAAQPGFEAVATVDPKGRVLDSKFTMGRPH